VSTTQVRGQRGLGIGGHHAPVRGGKDEWLTPPAIVRALGPFDLDPCSPINRPWPTAAEHLTVEDDGLTADWPAGAFVWCNPPDGTDTWQWLDRLAAHPSGGTALIFARTEVAGFVASVWCQASALLFIEGRLHFHHVTGERAAANSGAPSVLVAYGVRAPARLRDAWVRGTIRGAYVETWRSPRSEAPALDDRGAP